MKILAWIIGIAFFAQLLCGSEITWVYNKEKANKAKQTFWSRTLVIANRIGAFKNAIWR